MATFNWYNQRRAFQFTEAISCDAVKFSSWTFCLATDPRVLHRLPERENRIFQLPRGGGWILAFPFSCYMENARHCCTDIVSGMMFALESVVSTCKHRELSQKHTVSLSSPSVSFYYTIKRVIEFSSDFFRL